MQTQFYINFKSRDIYKATNIKVLKLNIFALDMEKCITSKRIYILQDFTFSALYCRWVENIAAKYVCET